MNHVIIVPLSGWDLFLHYVGVVTVSAIVVGVAAYVFLKAIEALTND